MWIEQRNVIEMALGLILNVSEHTIVSPTVKFGFGCEAQALQSEMFRNDWKKVKLLRLPNGNRLVWKAKDNRYVLVGTDLSFGNISDITFGNFIEDTATENALSGDLYEGLVKTVNMDCLSLKARICLREILANFVLALFTVCNLLMSRYTFFVQQHSVRFMLGRAVGSDKDSVVLSLRDMCKKITNKILDGQDLLFQTESKQKEKKEWLTCEIGNICTRIEQIVTENVGILKQKNEWEYSDIEMYFQLSVENQSLKEKITRAVKKFCVLYKKTNLRKVFENPKLKELLYGDINFDEYNEATKHLEYLVSLS